MALENFRTQKIIWDRANKKIFETIEANSGDSNGRKLVVQVINQEVTEVLSETTLSLGWKSRKGAKGLDAFNVVDASKGIFEIYYTTEMLSNIGNLEASLILIDSTGRIESSTFTINVTPSTVDDGSVESENSFTALTEALVKVSDLEGNYAPRLNEVTEQLADTVASAARPVTQTIWREMTDRGVNIKWFGAKGDGITDDYAAIQAAIDFARDNKLIVFIPAGLYIISYPLRIYSFTRIVGAGKDHVTLRKYTESSIGSNDRIVDCLIYGSSVSNFTLSGFSLRGNRKSYVEGNGVTTHGIAIFAASYYCIEDVYIRSCKNGIFGRSNYIGNVFRVTAAMCQEYGFDYATASTSIVFNNCVSFGSGGGFKLSGCIYMTILSPACDENNGGGRSEDPFLPEGSGGNHQLQNFIFHFSASVVTVISPGTENGYSGYIFSEGGKVTVLTPYVYNLQNHAPVYSFIETRGTGVSDVEIINPDFRNITNMAGLGFQKRGFFVERPEVQKITLSRYASVDSTFGEYAFVNMDGIHFTHAIDLVADYDITRGFSQTDSPFSNHNLGDFTDGAQTVEFDSKRRKLKFDRGSSNVPNEGTTVFNMRYRMPLAISRSNSRLNIKIVGTFTHGGGTPPTINIVKATDLTGTGTILHTISGSNGVFNVKRVVELTNLSTDFIYLEVVLPHGASVVTLEKYRLQEIY